MSSSRPSSAPYGAPPLSAHMVASYAASQLTGLAGERRPLTHRDPRLAIPRSSNDASTDGPGMDHEDRHAFDQQQHDDDEQQHDHDELEDAPHTDEEHGGGHTTGGEDEEMHDTDGGEQHTEGEGDDQFHDQHDDGEHQQEEDEQPAQQQQDSDEDDAAEEQSGRRRRKGEQVQVAVRCRPLLPSEQLYAGLPAAARTLTSPSSAQQQGRVCVQVPNAHQVLLAKSRLFEFDYAFGPECTQEQLYQQAGVGLVKAAFQGYNSTILAYGQTGSGKTFTMGSGGALAVAPQDLGLIPRVVQDLYARVERAAARGVTVTTKVSYLEIYREELKDLLHPAPTAAALAATGAGAGFGRSASSTSGGSAAPISIREDTSGGVLLVGVREESVSSLADIQRALHRGSIGRTTGSTLMNTHSSRSHSIFTITIEQKRNETQNPIMGKNGQQIRKSEVTRSKFHLVDLAGSERAKKTGATGTRFAESVNINRGLLALGNVIQALAANASLSAAKGSAVGAVERHVNFRDSILTRLLKDSLGGNARTLMVACISPADSNFEETHTTLKYASRARHIRNRAVVNKREEVVAIPAPSPSPPSAAAAAAAVSQNVAAAVAAVRAASEADLGAMRREIDRLQEQLASQPPTRALIHREDGDDGGSGLTEDEEADPSLPAESLHSLRTRHSTVARAYSFLHSLFLSLKAEHGWLLSGLSFFVRNLAELYELESKRDGVKDKVIALRKEYDSLVAAQSDGSEEERIHSLSAEIKAAQRSYVTYRDLLLKMREDLANFLQIYSREKMDEMQEEGRWDPAASSPDGQMLDPEAEVEFATRAMRVTGTHSVGSGSGSATDASETRQALQEAESSLSHLREEHSKLESAFALAQEDLKYDDEIFEEKVRALREVTTRATQAEEDVKALKEANRELHAMMSSMKTELERKFGSAGVQSGANTARSQGLLSPTPRGGGAGVASSALASPGSSSAAMVGASPLRDARLFRDQTDTLAREQEEDDEVLTAMGDEHHQPHHLEQHHQQQDRTHLSEASRDLIAQLRSQYAHLCSQLASLRAEHSRTLQSRSGLATHMSSRKAAYVAAQQQHERRARDVRIALGMKRESVAEMESHLTQAQQAQLSRSQPAAHSSSHKVSEANVRALAEAEQHYQQLEQDLALKQRLLASLSPRAGAGSASSRSGSGARSSTGGGGGGGGGQGDVRASIVSEVHHLEKALKDVQTHLENLQLNDGSEAGTPLAQVDRRLAQEIDEARQEVRELEEQESALAAEAEHLAQNYEPSRQGDKASAQRLDAEVQREEELIAEMESAQNELRMQLQELGVDPDEQSEDSRHEHVQPLEINVLTASGNHAARLASAQRQSSSSRPVTAINTAAATAAAIPSSPVRGGGVALAAAPSPQVLQALKRKTQWLEHQVSTFLVEAARVEELSRAQQEERRMREEANKVLEAKQKLLDRSLRASGMGSLADAAREAHAHAHAHSSNQGGGGRPGTGTGGRPNTASSGHALNQSLASVNKQLGRIEEQSSSLLRQSQSLSLSARRGDGTARGGRSASDAAMHALQQELDYLSLERSRMEAAREAILAHLARPVEPSSSSSSSSTSAPDPLQDDKIIASLLRPEDADQLAQYNEQLDDLEVEMEYKRERIEDMRSAAAAAAAAAASSKPQQQQQQQRGDSASTVPDPAAHRAAFLEKVSSMFDLSDPAETRFLAQSFIELQIAHRSALDTAQNQAQTLQQSLAEKDAHLAEMENSMSLLLQENDARIADMEAEFESRARDIAAREQRKAEKRIREMEEEFKQRLLQMQGAGAQRSAGGAAHSSQFLSLDNGGLSPSAQQQHDGDGDEADLHSHPAHPPPAAGAQAKSPVQKLGLLHKHMQQRQSVTQSSNMGAAAGDEQHRNQLQHQQQQHHQQQRPPSNSYPQPLRTYTPALPNHYQSMNTPLLYNQSPSSTPRNAFTGTSDGGGGGGGALSPSSRGASASGSGSQHFRESTIGAGEASSSSSSSRLSTAAPPSPRPITANYTPSLSPASLRHLASRQEQAQQQQQLQSRSAYEDVGSGTNSAGGSSNNSAANSRLHSPSRGGGSGNSLSPPLSAEEKQRMQLALLKRKQSLRSSQLQLDRAQQAELDAQPLAQHARSSSPPRQQHQAASRSQPHSASQRQASSRHSGGGGGSGSYLQHPDARDSSTDPDDGGDDFTYSNSFLSARGGTAAAPPVASSTRKVVVPQLRLGAAIGQPQQQPQQQQQHDYAAPVSSAQQQQQRSAQRNGPTSLSTVGRVQRVMSPSPSAR